MAKRKSTWASEAAQSALLRYAPQLRALTELQQEAKSTYKTGVAQARGNADATVAAVRGAQRETRGFYDQAGLDQARTASIVSQDIGGLSLNPDLRAAVGLEQADASSRVSSGRAQALSGLSQQGVAAKAGGQYASNKAYDDLVTALQKIGTQRQGILSDQGTFTATEQARLNREAKANALRVKLENMGNSQSERNSLRSSGIDPDTGKPIPGGKLDPAAKKAKLHGKVSATGKPLNTGDAHATARDKIQQGLAALGTLDPDRTDRHETAPLLVGGHKSQELYDTVPAPTAANPKATKQVRRVKGGIALSTPDIPGVGQWATIAADVYYDGHLSRANQKILADNGYSIRSLGLPTYAQWRKSHPRPRRAASNYYGGAGAGSGTS
jgi:hypothetical protein